MAGTLTISTLSDGTNSTSSTNCIQGSAKAWVNFNGSGGATVKRSYNVSSVTRNSTGNYTISFTTAFPNGNYVVCGSTDYTGTSVNQAITIQNNNAGSPSTTSAQISAIAYDGTLFDNGGINLAFFSA